MSAHQQLLMSYPSGTLPITWVSATVTSMAGTGVSSLSVNLPAYGTGDLLIMHVSHFWNVNINTPSGWTALSGDLAGGVNYRSRVFYMIATSSSGATTVTVTGASTCRMAATVNKIQAGTFDSSVPPERASLWTNNGTPNPPTLSPSWGSMKTLWIANGSNENGLGIRTLTSSPLPDGQAHYTSTENGSATCSIYTCHTISEVGTLDPAAYGLSATTSNSLGETIAVKPLNIL